MTAGWIRCPRLNGRVRRQTQVDNNLLCSESSQLLLVVSFYRPECSQRCAILRAGRLGQAAQNATAVKEAVGLVLP